RTSSPPVPDTLADRVLASRGIAATLPIPVAATRVTWLPVRAAPEGVPDRPMAPPAVRLTSPVPVTLATSTSPPAVTLLVPLAVSVPDRVSALAFWISSAPAVAFEVLTLPARLTAPPSAAMLTVPLPALTTLPAPWLTPSPLTLTAPPPLLTLPSSVSVPAWS